MFDWLKNFFNSFFSYFSNKASAINEENSPYNPEPPSIEEIRQNSIARKLKVNKNNINSSSLINISEEDFNKLEKDINALASSNSAFILAFKNMEDISFEDILTTIAIKKAQYNLTTLLNKELPLLNKELPFTGQNYAREKIKEKINSLKSETLYTKELIAHDIFRISRLYSSILENIQFLKSVNSSGSSSLTRERNTLLQSSPSTFERFTESLINFDNKLKTKVTNFENKQIEKHERSFTNLAKNKNSTLLKKMKTDWNKTLTSGVLRYNYSPNTKNLYKKLKTQADTISNLPANEQLDYLEKQYLKHDFEDWLDSFKDKYKSLIETDHPSQDWDSIGNDFNQTQLVSLNQNLNSIQASYKSIESALPLFQRALKNKIKKHLIANIKRSPEETPNDYLQKIANLKNKYLNISKIIGNNNNKDKNILFLKNTFTIAATPTREDKQEAKMQEAPILKIAETQKEPALEESEEQEEKAIEMQERIELAKLNIQDKISRLISFEVNQAQLFDLLDINNNDINNLESFSHDLDNYYKFFAWHEQNTFANENNVLKQTFLIDFQQLPIRFEHNYNNAKQDVLQINKTIKDFDNLIADTNKSNPVNTAGLLDRDELESIKSYLSRRPSIFAESQTLQQRPDMKQPAILNIKQIKMYVNRSRVQRYADRILQNDISSKDRSKINTILKTIENNNLLSTRKIKNAAAVLSKISTKFSMQQKQSQVTAHADHILQNPTIDKKTKSEAKIISQAIKDNKSLSITKLIKLDALLSKIESKAHMLKAKQTLILETAQLEECQPPPITADALLNGQENIPQSIVTDIAQQSPTKEPLAKDLTDTKFGQDTKITQEIDNMLKSLSQQGFFYKGMNKYAELKINPNELQLNNLKNEIENIIEILPIAKQLSNLTTKNAKDLNILKTRPVNKDILDKYITEHQNTPKPSIFSFF